MVPPALILQHVIVKFDHITEPCTIEMTRSKFMLLKSFDIYRKQFPLILACAVTIHKCQGLSFDCAIVDLSSKIFCAGMVRSLDGLLKRRVPWRQRPRHRRRSSWIRDPSRGGHHRDDDPCGRVAHRHGGGHHGDRGDIHHINNSSRRTTNHRGGGAYSATCARGNG